MNLINYRNNINSTNIFRPRISGKQSYNQGNTTPASQFSCWNIVSAHSAHPLCSLVTQTMLQRLVFTEEFVCFVIFTHTCGHLKMKGALRIHL